MGRLGIFFFCLAGFARAEIRDSIAVDSAAIPVSARVVKYQAIPSESKITYFLKHPFHQVEGSSNVFDCTVELGPDTLQAKINVKAPVAAFNSGSSSRDSHTMEILDAFKFPFVEFVSDSVRHDQQDYRVFGKLSFHGVTKPVDFLVEWWQKDGKTHVEAEFKIKLSGHKVKRPTLMMLATEDELRIKVHAVAKNP